MEEGHALFHLCNSLVLSKGLLYISTMPKGEVEGVLAFLVRTYQCRVALNGVHHDAGHQGQQRTLALAQECFWWSMMVDDCRALMQSCLWCCTFEGAVPKAPLCPIRAHTTTGAGPCGLHKCRVHYGTQTTQCQKRAGDYWPLHVLCHGSHH